MTHDKYKGWDVYYDPTSWNPAGCWSATSRSYAPDCDEDGFFADPDTYAAAKTYDDLLAEIDAIIEEQKHAQD